MKNKLNYQIRISRNTKELLELLVVEKTNKITYDKIINKLINEYLDYRSILNLNNSLSDDNKISLIKNIVNTQITHNEYDKIERKINEALKRESLNNDELRLTISKDTIERLNKLTHIKIYDDAIVELIKDIIDYKKILRID